MPAVTSCMSAAAAGPVRSGVEGTSSITRPSPARRWRLGSKKAPWQTTSGPGRARRTRAPGADGDLGDDPRGVAGMEVTQVPLDGRGLHVLALGCRERPHRHDDALALALG